LQLIDRWDSSIPNRKYFVYLAMFRREVTITKVPDLTKITIASSD